jgi:hypothetical protein
MFLGFPQHLVGSSENAVLFQQSVDLSLLLPGQITQAQSLGAYCKTCLTQPNDTALPLRATIQVEVRTGFIIKYVCKPNDN